MGTKPSCAIYVRVSTRHQAEEGFSLQDQRDTLTAHADQQGWEHEVFEDAGISGEKLDERPGLQRLLAGVDEGKFGVVLVVDDSRLARDELVGALIRDRLKQAGVRLATPHGERNLADPSDNFVANVLAAASAFEQDLRTSKMIAGVRNAAKEGYWVGGPPPFGYRTVPDGSHVRLAVDEDEATVIRRAVSLVVDDGLSTYQAALVLNGLGLKPRLASQFSYRLVRNILRNETLGGTWTFCLPSKKSSRRGEQPITVDVPPIIPRQRYELLTMALTSVSHGQSHPYRTYPLSKRLFGLCGTYYYGQFRNDRGRREYLCYGRGAHINDRSQRCSDTRFHADDIDVVVWEQVAALLGEPERLMEMARDFLGMRGEQVRVERDQLGAIDRKIDNLTLALTDRAREALKYGMPGEVLAAAVAELSEERDALLRHRDQLRAWEAQTAGDAAHMRRLWDLAEMAHARLPLMELDEQKQVHALLDVRVTVLEHATRSTPAAIRIEGAVHDALLDATSDEGLPDVVEQVGGMPFRLQTKVQ